MDSLPQELICEIVRYLSLIDALNFAKVAPYRYMANDRVVLEKYSNISAICSGNINAVIYRTAKSDRIDYPGNFRPDCFMDIPPRIGWRDFPITFQSYMKQPDRMRPFDAFAHLVARRYPLKDLEIFNNRFDLGRSLFPEKGLSCSEDDDTPCSFICFAKDWGIKRWLMDKLYEVWVSEGRPKYVLSVVLHCVRNLSWANESDYIHFQKDTEPFYPITEEGLEFKKRIFEKFSISLEDVFDIVEDDEWDDIRKHCFGDFSLGDLRNYVIDRMWWSDNDITRERMRDSVDYSINDIRKYNGGFVKWLESREAKLG